MAASALPPRALRILALSGSLRAGSTNSGLARAAIARAGAHVSGVVGDISALPLYNGDVEAVAMPPAVLALRAQARAADAFVLASTEYNYSVSGVLKNAIDWLSRPGADGPQPMAGKAALIVSTGGGSGGGRAQLHLRQVLVYVDVHAVNKPELAINIFDGKQRFDAQGNLTDEATAKHLEACMASLATLSRQLLK